MKIVSFLFIGKSCCVLFICYHKCDQPKTVMCDPSANSSGLFINFVQRNQSGAGPKITPVAYKIKRRKTIHANETNAYAAHWQGAFGNEEIRAGTHKSYWSCYIVQRMHPTTASFLGGLRIYKIVLLGEGGVGKSGEYELTIRAQSGVKISRPLTKGICEQTFKIDR